MRGAAIVRASLFLPRVLPTVRRQTLQLPSFTPISKFSAIRLGIPSEAEVTDIHDYFFRPPSSWTVESRRLLPRLRGKILGFFLPFSTIHTRRRRRRPLPSFPSNPFHLYSLRPTHPSLLPRVFRSNGQDL